ncbi:PHP domain-containing protein [Pseudidiomarina sp. 1APP75-32.1]|uniref:PHP domain-containing protein n=1 Tax=Pseudidiomarina terrestris TaxID=2820060 RepID=A0AAW7QUD1_9GAMM|nr:MULTISPECIES: PHP domain-containing protein [unclassified Pseudidiomarina]MDN7123860.1 PHP domain-containing protein [Pseudidiomarina sp. 1APP75-32.1]MDN7127614.1 PHP domain-containing protein [Pseudidiomarina sp. 1APR75-33.1]MDN7138800.1 PHP domain-containing protein [Pseudidiomarina sp. 1ASP75-14]
MNQASKHLYDLHCHSHFSDGELAPADLVQRAAAHGVTHLALTDHDTVAGLEQAAEAIAAHELELELISGVEITCRWQGFEIHLVGLQVDAEHPALLDLLQRQQQLRHQRYQTMLEKLHKAGIDVTPPMAAELTMPTRKHLAEALVEQGWVKDFESAFQRYLGKGQQAYVATDWSDLESAIAAVHAAGGKAVLAHPHAYQLSNKWLRKLLQEAKNYGLDGLEVAISQQSPGQRLALATMAKELGLAASAGSDFHGPRPWRELGKNLCLPPDTVPIWSQWSPSTV